MFRKLWRKPPLHSYVARLLREKRASEPKVGVVVKTNAKCTDRKMDALLGGFLFQSLNDKDRRRFERHVRTCIACTASVHNAYDLMRVAKLNQSSQAHKP